MNVSSYSRTQMSKVLGVFSVALIVSLIGFFVGQFVPPAFFLPLHIAELFLVIVIVIMSQCSYMSYFFMYTFMFISGITVYAIIAEYIGTIGTPMVLRAFLLTVVTFSLAAIYAYSTKRDFSYLKNFLFMSLILLIGLGLINVFSPFSGTTEMLVSGFGVFVFIGYTLFDFNRMAKEDISDESIPLMVVSIYVDFINLFIHMLRLLAALIGEN